MKGDLREVAEQFEAIFINQFLAQSRKTKLAEDLFGNKGTETYNSLLDQERAQQLAVQLIWVLLMRLYVS